jgi:TonB-linked SusC/RagA family outer membrane protein
LFDDFYKKLNTMIFVSSEVNKWMTVRGRFIHTKESQETPFSYTGGTYDPMYYLYRWHNVTPYGTYHGAEFRGGVAEMKAARPIENDAYFNRLTLGTTLKLAKGLTADFDFTSGQTFATSHTVGGYMKGIDFWNLAAGQTFDDKNITYTSATYDYVQNTSSKNLRNTYNGYMTYENKFGDHSFKAMAGANVEDGEYLYLGAKRSGVYNFDLPELNLANGDQSIVFLSSGNHTWWSIAGFFGRLNYAYKDKYLLEVDGRYDGVSKFASGRRWGFYPSASAGWRITEEPWMQSLRPVVSTMKLRGSYGENGNQDVPMGAYFPSLSVTNPTALGNYWLVNGNFVPYIANAAALVDPSLTWETVRTTDIGLDSRFFDDKLGATVEWYQRKTLDVISPGEVVPSTVGATAAVRNFGELTTKGIEVSIDYRHTFSNGLHLTLTGQFSDYKSVVSQYAAANDPGTGTAYYKNKVLGDIWGYKTEGLFQKEDFVWENGAIKQTIQPDGQSKNTMAEGVASQYILESGTFKFGPGDVRFKDLNGDGVINYGTNTVGNPGDRTVIGNTQPRYQYSFRLDADWKGFDIGIFFQGVGKRNIWATGNMVLPGYYAAEANFAHTLDYWTPENTGAFYPRPLEYSQTAKWNYLPNDRYLLNVAYLRLKNLSVGYSLPQKLVSKVNIQKFRIYFNGENLFEFDKLGGVPIDPEIDWTSTTSNDSRSFGRSYPYRRSLSMGIQLEF